MQLLKTIGPEEAQGELKEIYSGFQNTVGMVPRPLVMYSASPGLQKVQLMMIDYYRNHPNLEFPLTTMIRYLVACEHNYEACIQFNSHLLKMQGMSEEDIKALPSNPEKAPLEEKDLAMLLFVMKGVKSPESVTQEDMDKLHGLGWTDTDIYDALHHGALMIGPSVLMKAFKV